MLDKNKVIEIAKNEIGYLEKNSAKELDDPKKNAGKKNFTKYARDLFPSLQAQAWCDMFVDWCFTKAYGAEKAKKLLGGYSAYTPDSAARFRNQKRYFTTNPQAGDVIFFRNSKRICHTGIVYKVNENIVYTIEGNTSNGAEVIPNGGGVFKKQYSKFNNAIDGYGRPNYEGV